MSSAASVHQGIYRSDFVRRIVRWLDAMPHPALAIEVSPAQVAGARFTRTGGVGGFAAEALPAGALAPSAVESNVLDAAAVNAAFASVARRLDAKDEDIALLLPDTVIRVFVQHFEEFPRSREEAEPILRWKLKKSVPFEADETVISYMRQQPKDKGVDVVTALSRLRIMREYEALAEACGLTPGVVLSSSLAAITLLDDKKPTLLARISGAALTTAIARDGVLRGYRCTELPAQGMALTPQMLLEEIFPMAAYYQDTWQEGIQSVCVAGLGPRLSEFVEPLRDEFQCEVQSLLSAAISTGRIQDDARPLADRELEGLVGWMLHRH